MRNPKIASIIAEVLKTALSAGVFLSLAAGLGAVDYGKYVTYVALLLILTPFTSAGLAWWAQPVVLEHGLKSLGSVAVVIAVITPAVAVVPLAAIAQVFGWDIFEFLAVASVELYVYPLWLYLSTGFLTAGRLKTYLVLSVLIPTAKLATLVFGLVLFGFSLTEWALLCALIGMCGALITTFLAGIPGWNMGTQLIQANLKRALSFAAVGSVSALNEGVDKLMLASLARPADLGSYAAGSRLVAIATTPGRALAMVSYPQYFQLAAEHDYRGMVRAAQTTALQGVKVGSVTVLLTIAVASILEYLVLPGYIGLLLVTIAACPLILLRPVQYAAGDLLYALGASRDRLLITLTSGALTAIAVPIGFALAGVLGASASVTVVAAVTALALGAAARSRIRKAGNAHDD